MGNFIKKIIVKFNSGNLLTDGNPVGGFLTKYMRNTDVFHSQQSSFVDNIKKKFSEVDYKQTTKNFVSNLKDSYNRMENYKHI
jgi:hypothetical protein